MYYCESIEKPLHILHVKTQQKLRAWNGDGPFVATGLWSHPWEVLHRIAEFSRRELTYDSDVLNDMTGILNEFKRMKRTSVSPLRRAFLTSYIEHTNNWQDIWKASKPYCTSKKPRSRPCDGIMLVFRKAFGTTSKIPKLVLDRLDG